jgi:hypothetical protein
MKGYHCSSGLVVSYRRNKTGTQHIAINVHRHIKPVYYADVSMPPEPLQIIQESVEWLTPSAMVMNIMLSVYHNVTTIQVHWLRDALQIPSAEKLQSEYDDDP